MSRLCGAIDSAKPSNCRTSRLSKCDLSRNGGRVTFAMDIHHFSDIPHSDKTGYYSWVVVKWSPTLFQIGRWGQRTGIGVCRWVGWRGCRCCCHCWRMRSHHFLPTPSRPQRGLGWAAMIIVAGRLWLWSSLDTCRTNTHRMLGLVGGCVSHGGFVPICCFVGERMYVCVRGVVVASLVGRRCSWLILTYWLTCMMRASNECRTFWITQSSFRSVSADGCSSCHSSNWRENEII